MRSRRRRRHARRGRNRPGERVHNARRGVDHVASVGVVTARAMPKEETFQDLSLIPPAGTQELWRWLYMELRGAILDGRLKPGARMPSTRSLGMQYSLSRGTVVVAFEQLQAEGYTRTAVGSGTYVASGVSDGLIR